MPDFVAEIIIEQYVAFREGRLNPAEPRTPDSTTPTTLAEFARTTLVPAIRASSDLRSILAVDITFPCHRSSSPQFAPPDHAMRILHFTA